jgi:hypothetical protein
VIAPESKSLGEARPAGFGPLLGLSSTTQLHTHLGELTAELTLFGFDLPCRRFAAVEFSSETRDFVSEFVDVWLG